MFTLLRWMLVPSLGLAILELATCRPLAAQTYTVTDLGTLGGGASSANGINNRGQVVGLSSTASGQTHAFLYSGGAMTDLGTLSGGTTSIATAINDSGQVVGYGGINEFGPQFREFTQGFIWQAGRMQSVGALYCPCSFNQRYGTSAAFAINGAGQVVGDGGTVRGETVRHAFLWQNDVMQDIGGGAGSFSISFAYGINGSGQVVGAIDGRAFLWQAGTRQDLGVLPGDAGSTARAVNGIGQVVGESLAPGASRWTAFLWDAGVMQSLGTLPGDAVSRANAINAAGQIVGWSGTSDGSTSRAFLWQHGALSDLNRLIPAGSGWVLTNATGINDTGQIAGFGLHNGQPRAFLLTPLAGSVTKLVNMSTRGQVGTANDMMIGGLIVDGTEPKTILLRGRGPSLGGAPFFVPGALSNPLLRLFSDSALIAQNDNWQDPPNCSAGFECGSATQITATGLDPCEPNPGQSTAPLNCIFESAILITLPPGAYTAQLLGASGDVGVGIVEAFDADGSSAVKLHNISTRGLVENGNQIMIGGFIIEGGAPRTVVIRGRGPSMGGAPFFIPGVLADPFLRVFSEATPIAENNDWQNPPACAASVSCGSAPEIAATGLHPCVPNPGQGSPPPNCQLESAILITLPAGAYTVQLMGAAGQTGVGLVEVFEVPF